MFEIERDIPIPQPKGGIGTGTAKKIALLAEGESMLFPHSLTAIHVRSAARSVSKYHMRRFTVRTLPDGIRVWRLHIDGIIG